MKHVLLSLFSLALTTGLWAQTPPTSAGTVRKALDEKAQMAGRSLVKNLRLSNIGPSIMSGRVVDLAVNPDRPEEFFVAYASGGLWHTQNNGTSFTPVMDQTPTQNLGAVTVHWPSGTVWAGTGENNASRSSYAGIGMYKSTDLGKTWSFMGLPDSHHIGRIVIHPDNPDVVVAAVAGHLYSPNEERGVYRTMDGGQTWQRTLYIDANTGGIDLVAAPGRPDILYASVWERDRKAWNFTGNGQGSGIYKSIDGGITWNRVSEAGSGFPTGPGVGRIGLAAFDANTVYAVLDNQDRRPKEGGDAAEGLTKEEFKKMSNKAFLDLDNGKLAEYLRSNRFPREYSATGVKDMVRSGKVKPADLATYLEDANSLLFDTPVIGAEVYRSDDGGRSWAKTHEGYIDDLYYSYGYYFGQIEVAAYDKDQIYIAGVPQLYSKDGGKTFKAIDGDNVHSDHHALWINPDQPGHLINGNDGGINITYDYGAHWIKNNAPEVGQFYAIEVDNQEPYHVYGGLQDNGVWEGPHTAEESSAWHDTGDYPWKRLLGGDGMQVEVDPRNANVVYTGFQFGNYFRIERDTEKRTPIQPKHTLGEAPYRFNWQTPILLSPHNADILYLGGNKLHRSMDRGDTWAAISDDLTRGGKKGNVAYGTLTTLSESPFQFGLLYTGSDDGLVYVSQNGGGSWERISDGFPGELWVSRVVASAHKKERVYAALNGYRWDDFTPYIYVSEDYGKTWSSLAGGIPHSPVNVVLEDPKNENLLYAGTDNGLYVSLDRGKSWQLMENGMPPVAVHDLVVQPQAGHLLVGTHGRSIYKADVNALQQTSAQDLDKDIRVYALENLRHSGRWGRSWSSWSEAYTPGLDVTFYSRSRGTVSARVKTADGITVSETQMQAEPGFNILSYDVAFSKSGQAEYLKKYKTKLEEADNGKTYLPKGAYQVELSLGSAVEHADFKIE
ncbi:beta propeller repeat protein [Robiginitalea sediminis]|uniref:glycosyl hydrolase n=1 Tax=Robiginitalea sediminis TaxID=1982593 RepID=UPI000B4A56DA|nr:glycosyl hydrolase [Robiginitalea sediminis]